MLLVATLVACGSRTVPPEPPPAGIIEDLRASAAAPLDVEAVAADAVDEEVLSSLLGDAGFESAVERQYSGPGGEIQRVEVRVVRFGSTGGAGRYLAWLRSHVEDVIGDAAPTTAMLSPSMSVYVHLPDPCCPKETALALASWRDGRDVLRVLVVGPGADGTTGIRLVASVQRWVEAA